MSRLQDFLLKSRYDVPYFIKTLTGIELVDWQPEFANAYTRGDRQISARSGHHVGKTTVLACIAAHFPVVTHPGTPNNGLGKKVVVTAPTSSQLHDAFVPELKTLISMMPEDVRQIYDIKQDRIEIAFAPSQNFITIATSRQEQPDALQGKHAKNGVVLIADEASGIPDAVFDAAGGSMAGHACQLIMTGNPLRTSGLFHKSHTVLKDNYTTFHVSCLDSSLVNPEYIEEKKLEYGEDSNAYRVRVLGEFPLSEENTVIGLHLIESAVERDIHVTYEDIVWGIDPARGGDRSALCKRAGLCVLEPVLFHTSPDTAELVAFVLNEWETTPEHMRPFEIMIDSIGIGGPVADRLRQLGLPCRDVNVSESTSMKTVYYRLRDELWLKTKEWFNGLNVRIPKDHTLITELSLPRLEYTESGGKMKVESKAKLKARGIRSPDAADSLVMTFAGTAGVARFGKRARSGKIKKRRMKGIV